MKATFSTHQERSCPPTNIGLKSSLLRCGRDNVNCTKVTEALLQFFPVLGKLLNFHEATAQKKQGLPCCMLERESCIYDAAM